jgi:spore maturation protein A
MSENEKARFLMLNYLWGFMIVLGVTVGVLRGQIGEVSKATINSSKEAVVLCITMLGIMAMWTGIMQVAKRCGLVGAFTRALRPVIRFLYPDVPKDHIVNEHIASNMIANILGLGWAATPMGLMAMKELKQLNHDSEVASCDMCTLLIVNISSLQLIPVNIIAYRSQYGSVNPAEILAAGLIATVCSTCVGITFSVLARKMSGAKAGRKK